MPSFDEFSPEHVAAQSEGGAQMYVEEKVTQQSECVPRLFCHTLRRWRWRCLEYGH